MFNQNIYIQISYYYYKVKKKMTYIEEIDKIGEILANAIMFADKEGYNVNIHIPIRNMIAINLLSRTSQSNVVSYDIINKFQSEMYAKFKMQPISFTSISNGLQITFQKSYL